MSGSGGRAVRSGTTTVSEEQNSRLSFLSSFCLPFVLSSRTFPPLSPPFVQGQFSSVQEHAPQAPLSFERKRRQGRRRERESPPSTTIALWVSVLSLFLARIPLHQICFPASRREERWQASGREYRLSIIFVSHLPSPPSVPPSPPVQGNSLLPVLSASPLRSFCVMTKRF